MTTGNRLFVDIRPNYAVSPGEVLSEYIAESGWSQKEVALRSGISEKHLSQIVNGSANISMDVSDRLALVLGTKPGFWIRLQNSYREQVDYLARAKALDGEKDALFS